MDVMHDRDLAAPTEGDATEFEPKLNISAQTGSAEGGNDMRPRQLLRVERITQRQRLDAKRLNGGETANIPVVDIVKTLRVSCQTSRIAALQASYRASQSVGQKALSEGAFLFPHPDACADQGLQF
ncbi:MAG: hypothetical protein ACT4P8_08880 [Betaproteobacteria bacterium]